MFSLLLIWALPAAAGLSDFRAGQFERERLGEVVELQRIFLPPSGREAQVNDRLLRVGEEFSVPGLPKPARLHQIDRRIVTFEYDGHYFRKTLGRGQEPEAVIPGVGERASLRIKSFLRGLGLANPRLTLRRFVEAIFGWRPSEDPRYLPRVSPLR